MGLSIDKNVQQIAFREHKSKDMSIPNQPVKTQSSYKGVDVLMGLTAIASTVIAGIALHNNNVLKKELKTVSNKLTEAEKTIQETAEKLKNQTKNEIPSFNANETVNEIMTNNQTSNTGKKVIKKSKNKKKVNKQQVEENSTQEGLRILEEDASAARKARKASDRRNQEWLEKQHKQKEQEYSDFWNKELNEKETQEGLRILEEDASVARKARKASNRRNQEWLEKQHRQKEQEINEFYSKNADKLNEMESLADKRLADRWVKEQENNAEAVRKARKASDRRNQEWLEKQHRPKELEMNEFYNQHNLRLGYLNVKANVRHFVNSKVDSVKNCFRKIQDKFSKDAQLVMSVRYNCLIIT